MDQFESLNHTKWDCKYHVVFIPKFRPEDACMGTSSDISVRYSGNWPNRGKAARLRKRAI